MHWSSSRLTVPWAFLLLSTVLGGPLVAADTGSLSGKVTLPAGVSPTACVIYIEGPNLKASAPTTSAKMSQVGKKFVPAVLTVAVGSTVSFPNEDKVFHNVFSIGSPTEFDLGQYRAGQSKTQTFTQVGSHDIFCNIHPDMFATVLVVPNDHFTQPGADGSFTLDGIPAGSYTVVGWIQLGNEVRNPVEIKAGAKATCNLALPGKLRPRQHTRKDGSDYGRYK